jgi:hypothetical protein
MITEYFKISEVVCPHVLEHYSLSNGWIPNNPYGHFAWDFFDYRLLANTEAIHRALGKTILINNGSATQRGLRCVLCKLIKDVFKKGILFTDPHMLAKAFDLTVVGMGAEEVRQYFIKNPDLLPFPVRFEEDVDWVHLDTLNNSSKKVVLFKA